MTRLLFPILPGIIYLVTLVPWITSYNECVIKRVYCLGKNFLEASGEQFLGANSLSLVLLKNSYYFQPYLHPCDFILGHHLTSPHMFYQVIYVFFQYLQAYFKCVHLVFQLYFIFLKSCAYIHPLNLQDSGSHWMVGNVQKQFGCYCVRWVVSAVHVYWTDARAQASVWCMAIAHGPIEKHFLSGWMRISEYDHGHTVSSFSFFRGAECRLCVRSHC